MSTAADTTRASFRKHSSRHVSTAAPSAAAAAGLFSDGCLLIIIFVVPFLTAGVRDTGVAVFIACSLLMGVAWAIQHLLTGHGETPFSYAVVLFAAAITLVGFQIVPLPQSWVHAFSPFSADYLSAWNDHNLALNGPGFWPTISLTPSLTRSGLVLLIAYATFFLTLLQKLKTLDDIDKLLKLIAVATILMAVVGVGQLFFGNGDFLWMFHHPLRDANWPAKGTFTNQNHFAHFLALGIGPLVWWWKKSGTVDGAVIRGRVRNSGFGVSRSTESYQQVIGGAISVVVFAGVLSFSRGGIASMALASLVSLAAMGGQWRKILRLAVPAMIFMMMGVMLFGTEMLQAKWEKIAGAQSLEDISQGRFLLWSALLAAAPSFWPAGAGVGSHAEVYKTWLEKDVGVRFSHAESGYLQVLIETGLSGLVIVLAAVGLCGIWAVKGWKAAGKNDRMRIAIVTSGLLVSALHSFADFAWYIPACLIFALMLAASLCRTQQLYSEDSHSDQLRTTTPWPGCLAMLLILVTLPVGQLSARVIQQDALAEPHWLAYRGESVAAGINSSYESLEALDDRLDTIIAHLEACLSESPADGRAMSDLAAAYLRRFERHQQQSDNPISVQEIKSTVLASSFANSKEISQWLKRAFGENAIDLYRAHSLAQKAVHRQPLRGKTYLILAQLGFLQQYSAEQSASLIQQAAQLRPFSPPVLYFVGMMAAENGDIDEACRIWKRAFHLADDIKPAILKTLSSQLSPEEITTRMTPGAQGLTIMFNLFRQGRQPDRQRWVAEHYVEQFREFTHSSSQHTHQFWLQSADIFQFLDKTAAATECIAQAVKALPADYSLRKRYGIALRTANDNAAALRELEWCRLRNPDDREVTEAIMRIEQQMAEESVR